MSKIERMDQFLESNKNNISSSTIVEVIDLIYGINLEDAPIIMKFEEDGIPLTGSNLTSRVVFDSFFNQYGEEFTGTDIRRFINEVFGINLDAISNLEGARISLYSKNQWVVREDTDLFVVHTGNGDVDVKVYPTAYFKEQTGLAELPTKLQHLLVELGYSFDVKIGSYYYSNPLGEAVPDSFKGKTMEALSKVIHQEFSHL